MPTPYVFIENLEAGATPPDDGILSKTVHADDRLKAGNHRGKAECPTASDMKTFGLHMTSGYS